MIWIIAVMGIVLLVALLLRSADGDAMHSGDVDDLSATDRKKARELAAKVRTRSQFKALERKLEAAEEKLGNVETEASYERAGARHSLLQMALDLASAHPIE